MVLFIQENSENSNSFIKKCFAKYLDMVKTLNLGVNLSDIVPQDITLNEFIMQVEINKTAKPYLSFNGQKLPVFFNLSHSNNVMALIMGEKSCGVDVEKVREVDYKAISERENFSVMPQSNDEFFELWTKHEALVKQSGKGLIDIKNISHNMLSKVKTIDILKGYKLSIVPADNLIIVLT